MSGTLSLVRTDWNAWYEVLTTRADVPCLDVCVYCRDSIRTVHHFSTHSCYKRRQQKNLEKETHRRDRYTQLRQTSRVFLSKIQQDSSNRLGHKRGFEEVDEPLISPKPTAPNGIVQHNTNTTSQPSNSTVSQSGAVSEQRLESSKNTTASTNRNGQFSSSLVPVADGYSGYSFAPIFYSSTIPPFYDQPIVYSLDQNAPMSNEGLELSNGNVVTPHLENQSL